MFNIPVTMDGTKVITVTMRSVLEMESMLMNYLAKLIGGNHLSLMEKLFLIDLNVKRDLVCLIMIG
jgi:hypothetical protein